MKRLMIILGVASLCIDNTASAFDNIEMPISEIPKPVLETALYYARGLVFNRYAYEDEDGVRIYEFEGIDTNNKIIDIEIIDDGRSLKRAF